MQSEKTEHTPIRKPVPDIFVIRFLVLLCVLLALLAGYYHALLKQEEKRYARIEDWYVRVRDQLGRDETQRLIDLSREIETSEGYLKIDLAE